MLNLSFWLPWWGCRSPSGFEELVRVPWGSLACWPWYPGHLVQVLEMDPRKTLSSPSF